MMSRLADICVNILSDSKNFGNILISLNIDQGINGSDYWCIKILAFISVHQDALFKLSYILFECIIIIIVFK